MTDPESEEKLVTAEEIARMDAILKGPPIETDEDLLKLAELVDEEE